MAGLSEHDCRLVDVCATESGKGTSLVVHEEVVTSNVVHLVFEGEGEVGLDARVSVEIRNGLVSEAHGVAIAVALEVSATEFGNPEWEVREGGGKRLDVVMEILEG